MRLAITSLLTIAAVAGAIAANYQPPVDRSSGVRLTWDANTESDLSHYSLYRSSTDGPVTDYELVTTTTTTGHIDSGLPSETAYWYFVTATDDAGNESAPSNIASATSGDVTPPGAPVGLTPASWSGRVTITIEGG